jgi:hypothetical protein
MSTSRIIELFEESGRDMWVFSIRSYTQFKIQFYINIPPFEWHMLEPEQEPFRIYSRMTYEFPLLNPVNNWKTFFALS